MPTIVIPTEASYQSSNGEPLREGRLLYWGAPPDTLGAPEGGAPHEDCAPSSDTADANDLKDLYVDTWLTVKLVSCGDSHGILVTDDNTIYSWKTDQTLSGKDDQKFDQSAFRKVSLHTSDQSAVAKVACGSHTFLVLGNGRVYSFGNNNCGRKVTGKQNEPVPRLLKSLLSRKVKDVACGDKHTLLLFTDGLVGTIGGNSNGQLGVGSKESRENITVLSSLDHVSAVACGDKHSLAVTASGELYVWGHRRPCGSRQGDLLRPTLVRCGGRRVWRVAGGRSHSAALTVDGCVYTWGAGGSGQLGHGPDLQYLTCPRRLTRLDHQTVQVGCGPDYTAAVTVSGDVYVWGQNTNHVVSHVTSPSATYYEPMKVELRGRRVKNVACGGCHVAAITGRISDADCPPELKGPYQEDSGDDAVEGEEIPDDSSDADTTEKVVSATVVDSSSAKKDVVSPALSTTDLLHRGGPILQLTPRRAPERRQPTQNVPAPRPAEKMLSPSKDSGGSDSNSSRSDDKKELDTNVDNDLKSYGPIMAADILSTRITNIGRGTITDPRNTGRTMTSSAKKRVQFDMNINVELFENEPPLDVSFGEVNELAQKCYDESPRYSPDFRNDIRELHQLRTWSKILANQSKFDRETSGSRISWNAYSREGSVMSNKSLEFESRRQPMRPLGSAKCMRRAKTWIPSASRSESEAEFMQLPEPVPPKGVPFKKVFGAFHPAPLPIIKSPKSAGTRQPPRTVISPVKPRTQVLVLGTVEQPGVSIPDKRKEINFVLDSRSGSALQRSRTFHGIEVRDRVPAKKTNNCLNSLFLT